ncbi:hypothetical protein DKP78_17620, partial [Enterococcus faecium]
PPSRTRATEEEEGKIKTHDSHNKKHAQFGGWRCGMCVCVSLRWGWTQGLMSREGGRSTRGMHLHR